MQGTLGAYAQRRFEELQAVYDVIGEVRGKGLSIGVDLVLDHNTRERACTEAAKDLLPGVGKRAVTLLLQWLGLEDSTAADYH
jgi:4-aminobutyrate aminotransferase-like enzyme